MSRRDYFRNRYKNDSVYRQKQLDNRKRNLAKKKLEIAPILAEFRKNGCALCGEKESACLAAHHVDPTTKEFSVGLSSRKRSVEKFVLELKKCICLCHNCHAKLHAGVLGLNLDLTVRVVSSSS